jgi:parvulin-like peptidyl-prolyl isomerase
MTPKFYVRLVVFIFFIFCFCASNIAAEEKAFSDHSEGMNIPPVVANVNGQPIDSHYIKFKFNRIMDQLKGDLEKALGGGQDSKNILDEQKSKIITDVINNEVIRELLRQEAKKANKTSDPKLVEKEYKKLMSAYPNEDAFQEALKSRDLDIKSLKTNIGIDLMIERLVESQIRGKIKIKKEAVKEFYDTHKDRFKRPESYRARHIYIPHFTKEMFKNVPKDQIEAKQAEFSQQAWESAKNILAEIRAGADFSEMAEKYSRDIATAKKGGDLGFMYKGVFPPKFDEAILKLKPNQVGDDVVKTPFGYHVVKLLETKPADTAPFKDVEQPILKHLITIEGQKKLAEYTENLKKDSKIEILYGS